MKGEDRAQQPGPRSDFNRATIVPRDYLIRFLTEYGDWRHLDAYARGGEIWALHIEHCAECRAVQARWDAEKKRGAA